MKTQNFSQYYTFTKTHNAEIILSVPLIYEGSNKILSSVGDRLISSTHQQRRRLPDYMVFYSEHLRDMVLNVGLTFGKDFCQEFKSFYSIRK